MSEVTVRIKYAKEYPVNLIGHLDTAAAIQRSMRRAAWPLKFTAGFNPRIKLSFTPPLSLGYTSDAEYVDVALIRTLEEYHIENFCRKTVKGLKIKEVRILSPEEPGVNELLIGFRYMVKFIQPADKAAERAENIVERGDEYIVFDVFKKSGGFRNPLKILGDGKYEIKKIRCIWKVNESEGDRSE